MYIDRWKGSRQGQYGADVGVGVGTRLPVHCSAAGKALLACLPAAEQQNLIAKLRLTRRAPKTITTRSALRTELGRVSAEGGVAVEDEECSAGRRAIAAPVVDAEGQPVAVVELVVPAEAYTRPKLLDLAAKVTGTAQRIAEALE